MKILSNAVWMLLCRFAADLLSFVLFAAIARVFGPSGTGEYAYAFALGNLAALIASGGFEEYGIRQYVLAKPSARSALWRDILSTQRRRLLLTLALLALYLGLAGHATRAVMV